MSGDAWIATIYFGTTTRLAGLLPIIIVSGMEPHVRRDLRSPHSIFARSPIRPPCQRGAGTWALVPRPDASQTSLGAVTFDSRLVD
jgi:hypothetical protein